MRISDWSSDVCSSDLRDGTVHCLVQREFAARRCTDASDHAGGDCASVVRDGSSVRGRQWPAWARHCRKGPGAEPGGADADGARRDDQPAQERSEEHTSELQSLMRSSYDVLCLEKK